MDIEGLARLFLKDIIGKEDRRGILSRNFKDMNLEESDVREVGRFIERKGFGTINWLPLGQVHVIANSNAIPFVNKNNNMTFEQKLKIIYTELSNRPNRKAELESILNNLTLEHDANIINEFVHHFKETEQVHVVAESKDGIDIVLTQKGLDYLHSPPKQEPQQPNISFEINANSIVNKGGIQSGSFESGIKDISNSAINSPNKNPTPTPKLNSPTGTKQTIQVILQVLAIIVAVLLATWGLWANGKLKWPF